MSFTERIVTAPALTVRDACAGDLPRALEIYAPEVLHGTATFETVPPSVDELAVRHATLVADGLPWLVAERDGRVVGYAYAAPYRPRPAYRHTVENSVYVETSCRGTGVGSALLGALIERCACGSYRQMLAVIGDSANTGSIALHASLGFRHVGTFTDVGRKHGRWLDTVLMQRALGAGADAPP